MVPRIVHLLLSQGRHDTSVDRGKTQDNHLPRVTSNLVENDVEPVSKGTESCEGDHVHRGKDGAPAVRAYCNHDHPSKDMHRSRIYLGVGTRANEGGAMTNVIRPNGTFS